MLLKLRDVAVESAVTTSLGEDVLLQLSLGPGLMSADEIFLWHSEGKDSLIDASRSAGATRIVLKIRMCGSSPRAQSA
jgi:hypothetical protein